MVRFAWNRVMTSHGARGTQPRRTLASPEAEDRRSRQWLWLGVGLALILLGYPLGLLLASGSFPDLWSPIYLGLVAAGLVAAFLFARAQRRRGVQPPAPPAPPRP